MRKLLGIVALALGCIVAPLYTSFEETEKEPETISQCGGFGALQASPYYSSYPYSNGSSCNGGYSSSCAPSYGYGSNCNGGYSNTCSPVQYPPRIVPRYSYSPPVRYYAPPPTVYVPQNSYYRPSYSANYSNVTSPVYGTVVCGPDGCYLR